MSRSRSWKLSRAEFFDDADQLKADGISVSTVYADPISEKVVVGLRSAKAGAQASLRASYSERVRTTVEGKVVGDACSGRFNCGNPPSEPWKGGIRIKSRANGANCTSAFLARRNANGNVVLVTAGHCLGLGGGNNKYWHHNDHNIGQSKGYTWEEGANSDVGWIDVESPGQVTPKNEFLAENASDVRSILYVRANEYQQPESFVCRSAVDSGYWCGFINGRNVSAKDVDGKDIVNLYTVDFDAIPGDSGGIYFLNQSVYGIHADSRDGVSPPAGKSWYTPAERAQNTGDLTVCTSSGC